MQKTVIDSHTKDVLRLLGETALRLADGQTVDINRLTTPLSTAVAASQPRLSSSLLTVPEACGRLRVSRWSFYQLIRQRQIETLTIGRRRLVPTSEIDRFIDNLAPAGGTT
ncbi:helix-turn-helix domain-containing protein [Mycobacteroides abscessus]|uniref:helix-turn-helix domain-containing protein n=1 Tax=Mycobacteroides abscessus TaxID=36809 RepID=UPI0003FDB579|nr:helix-turn-helix domain-containing protein [Mycobacteroides abscessus]MBN7551377.1 helix-turn-helix domain-containing protein [Mycobacteroides abscessus subsp. abscessus]MDM2692223.1 helix-turn-helix domain-containing protein [Mycobacteroides abscessus]MDM2697035.1 helix-turn-helix domain-containing protein [Mycobacteroides abscessus]MDM2702240.1 helix-turn-helix domain-containing protein [Mycobacteroides abscessus]MDO3265634.1 helix-turn-helix domain-containing protein [Mycobacteroides abs